MKHKGDPRFRKANPVPLSGFMADVIKSMGGGERIRFEQVRRDWNDIVGGTNARNTRPVGLEDGVLTIAVRGTAWLNQVRFYKKTFLARLREHRSAADVDVRDIRFQLDRS